MLALPSLALADKPADKPAKQHGHGAKKGLDAPTWPVEQPTDVEEQGAAPSQEQGELHLGGGEQITKPVGGDEVVVQPATTGPVSMTIASSAAAPATPAPCTSNRRITIRLRPYSIRSGRVTMNGKRVTVRRTGKRFVAVIDLRGKAAGTYVVRTTVVTRHGRIRTGTRRFKTCVQ